MLWILPKYSNAPDLSNDAAINCPVVNSSNWSSLPLRLAFKDSIKALKTEDKELALEVTKLEDRIDTFEKKFKRNHIRRLRAGTCDMRSDFIFTDTLRNLERIGDHADNIASSLLTNFTNV